MAMSGTLKAFLEAQQIPYTAQQHPAVYTAQEIAAAQHVPGRQLAKAVLLKANTGLVLAVLPAIQRVNFGKLKTVLGATRVSLASEAHIKQAFPDVEIGAMSIFGNLYNVPVVVDASLAGSDDIVCNAGTHTDTIKVRYQDFARAAKPKVGVFGMSVPGQAAKTPKKSKKPASKKKKPARPSAPRRAAAKKHPTRRKR